MRNKFGFTLAEVFLPYSAGCRRAASRIIRLVGGVTSASTLWAGSLRDTAPYRKCGFTLAEVLITLGIIGIVAAMTMPTLIGNYQKKQTVTQLKKAYSEINQAISVAQAEFGTLDSWDFSGFNTPQERVTYFSEKYLFPNINTIKKCIPVTTECWVENVYNLDGASAGHVSMGYVGKDKWGAFVSNSGYSVLYWLHGTGNGAWFYVDINGQKKPNIVGKDIFALKMSWGNNGSDNNRKLGFYPAGMDYNSFTLTREELIDSTNAPDYKAYGCKKGAGFAKAGDLCAALIMYDGWEIKDGYPW